MTASTLDQRRAAWLASLGRGDGLERWLLNLTASNTQRFRAAAARTDRNAIVATIGPSTTCGQSLNGGTTLMTGSWPMQMAAMLARQGVPAGASNMFGDHACWATPQTAANYMAGDTRVVLTGSAAPGPFTTAGGNGFAMNGAAGSITFTPVTSITTYEIWYRDGVGRNWSWSIDGGAATQVSGAASPGPRRIVVRAASAGPRPITLTWVAGNVQIIGISGYDDTAGRREISVYNWGISGARSDQFLQNSDATAGRMAMWSAVAPDLSILDDWAINDWRQAIALPVFRSNLVAGIAQGKLSGDVIVTTPLWDAGITGNTPLQSDYAAATIAAALEADVPVIDVRAAWRSFAIANGLGWYSDTVHPTLLGYATKAALVGDVIRRVLNLWAR
ncbi:SGNH/GDSL hydrolase family protein [Sphingomonas sp. NPDC079357]|uniref:SGNH/GDSL hydrolase family protein n=1 Tax=Sphingomonas sp. NPDC079357 TaxID=3364518 RepID=UPI00384F60A0